MIMDHKLKLMVVDDSPLFRTWLIRSLSEDDRFQVVGYAINAFDAQITADAVQQYLDEQREEGKLTIGKLHRLMNLDLDDPDNELSGYMSAGSKNALVISVDADIKTGQLEKMIYQDKWVKVRVTVEADGTRKVEEIE